MDYFILTFITVLTTAHLGIRWHHSGRNHWYIFASGLVWAAGYLARDELGLETIHNRDGINEYLFVIGNFISGCLVAILFGFIEKCYPRDPRK